MSRTDRASRVVGAPISSVFRALVDRAALETSRLLRYVDVVVDDRVVQAVDFVSDDPALAGTMTMTWSMHSVDHGTRVDITADDVPDGIGVEDHAAGMASSLEHLARYLEP